MATSSQSHMPGAMQLGSKLAALDPDVMELDLEIANLLIAQCQEALARCACGNWATPAAAGLCNACSTQKGDPQGFAAVEVGRPLLTPTSVSSNMELESVALQTSPKGLTPVAQAQCRHRRGDSSQSSSPQEARVSQRPRMRSPRPTESRNDSRCDALSSSPVEAGVTLRRRRGSSPIAESRKRSSGRKRRTERRSRYGARNHRSAAKRAATSRSSSSLTPSSRSKERRQKHQRATLTHEVDGRAACAVSGEKSGSTWSAERGEPQSSRSSSGAGALATMELDDKAQLQARATAPPLTRRGARNALFGYAACQPPTFVPEPTVPVRKVFLEDALGERVRGG
mmetsp:Transcript_8054/g.20019  ORF Transcript_8054/g.20019 Transcript_8054/m.20019 type:complete len:341 (+) Transcript_8054:213-1235(+)